LGPKPKNAVSSAWQFFLGLCHLIISLYLPFFKFRFSPDIADREAVELYYKKCKALVIINPKRFFIESFYFYKKFTRFDFTKFENGVGKFISASSLFTFTGLSFYLGQKILDFASDKVDLSDDRLNITHDLLWTQLQFFRGDWNTIKEIDDALVDRNLKLGETWLAAMHYYWHGFPILFSGKADISIMIVDRLENIATVYNYDISMLLRHIFSTKFLIEYRRLSEARVEIENGISLQWQGT